MRIWIVYIVRNGKLKVLKAFSDLDKAIKHREYINKLARESGKLYGINRFHDDADYTFVDVE